MIKVKQALGFYYQDQPLSQMSYQCIHQFFSVFFKHYLKVEHGGATSQVMDLAPRGKCIAISHHANTMEAMAFCNFFYQRQLGKMRGLIFKQIFMLPFFRELSRAMQCLPVNIENGLKLLEEGHCCLMPEGLEFVQRYKGEAEEVLEFHTGFLRIAQAYLKKHPQTQLYILPIGHAGFDTALPFWILQNPWMVENIFKPLLKYPLFFWPKYPCIKPGKTWMQWGKPYQLKLRDLKTPQQLMQLARQFQAQVQALKNESEKILAQA